MDDLLARTANLVRVLSGEDPGGGFRSGDRNEHGPGRPAHSRVKARSLASGTRDIFGITAAILVNPIGRQFKNAVG